jgi:MFS family permease
LDWWQRLRLGRKTVIVDAEERSLLHNHNFSRLWGSQILSQVAQQLLNFALIVRVFELAQHTRLANISVALVVLSFGVPSILFAATAGVYVDHWNRKLVLLIANIIRGLLVLGYLGFEHNLAMVLLLSFLISSTTQFFSPAEAASIPVLVPERHLLRANSLFVFTMYASFIVGYGAAAPVIALFGPRAPYILTSVMFLVAALFVVRLPSIRAVTKTHVRFLDLMASTGTELRKNWALIRSRRHLSFPILQLTVSQAMVGVVLALAPALSLAVLHRPLQNASQFLIIPAGIGMVAGVLLIGHLVKRFTKISIIAVGLLIAAVTLTLLGVAGLLEHIAHMHHYREVSVSLTVSLVVAVLVLVLGLMNGLISIASQTILQEHTTDETRGKVFGALNMMVNIAATLPILFAGILADLIGVSRVVAVLGLMLLVFALGQIYWLQHKGAALKDS